LTQDEIIEVAQECGLIGMRPHLDGIYTESLVTFAKLVAAKEREACAKLCETEAENPSDLWEEKGCWAHAAENCAGSIRARGQA